METVLLVVLLTLVIRGATALEEWLWKYHIIYITENYERTNRIYRRVMENAEKPRPMVEDSNKTEYVENSQSRQSHTTERVRGEPRS